MAVSALGELANVMTGLAAGSLETGGYPYRISPPTIVKGTGVKFITHTLPLMAVPLSTELGDVRIYLALTEASKKHSERGSAG